MTIEKVRKIFDAHQELIKIAKQLHHQDENACNYGLTSRQTKRVENLEAEAESLAKTVGLRAYHQGDPRGASLYLVENLKAADNGNYTNGVCVG